MTATARRLFAAAIEPLEARRLLSGSPDLPGGGGADGTPVVTLSIDAGDVRQEISGFGSAMISWTDVESYSDPEFFNDIANDIGASIVRINILPSFEEFNDNDDPYHMDWDGFDPDALAPVLDYVAELEKRQDMTVLASVWSPPFWMKASHEAFYGSHLDPVMRAEFAEFLSAFVISADRDYGVEVDVVSLQNEPLFVMGYESSVMPPWQMAETYKVVADRFAAEGLGASIMLGEDLNTGQRFEWWVDEMGAILADPATGEWPDFVWGTHFGSPDLAPMWADGVIESDNPIWFTEAGGKGGPNWGAGLGFLREAQDYINDGRIGAYLEWQSQGDGHSSWYWPDPDHGGEIRKTGRYAATKHLSRWVRPGAHAVASATGGADFTTQTYGEDVKASVFRHDAAGSGTIVLSNNAPVPAEVWIAGADGLPAGGDWRMYLSDFTDRDHPEQWGHLVPDWDGTPGGGFGAGDSVDPDDTLRVTLPAKSMVTLYSGAGEPFEPVELDTARGPDVAADPRRLAQLSYLHQVLGVGWLAGVQQEMTDDRMLARYFDGRDVLHMAASVARGDMLGSVTAVLDRAQQLGMDIARPDDEGVTPYMIAAGSKQFGEWFSGPGVFEVVPPQWAVDRLDAFEAAGADLHARDDWGRTALHHSAGSVSFYFGTPPERFDLVTPHLLSRGLDANKVDRTGRTALDWAREEHNLPAVAALQAWDTDLVGPQILDARALRGPAAVGGELTFDEALAAFGDDAFVLVREDGLEVPVTITREDLPGGNTRVRVLADSPAAVGTGWWRVYVDGPGAVGDAAGNGWFAPIGGHSDRTPGHAEFAKLTGDANGDGRVNTQDMLVMIQNWNAPAGATVAQGDFTGDGKVDLYDWQTMFYNWGQTLSAAPTGDFGGRALPALSALAEVSDSPFSGTPVAATATASSVFEDEESGSGATARTDVLAEREDVLA